MFIPSPLKTDNYKENSLRQTISKQLNNLHDRDGWARVDELWTNPVATSAYISTVNVPRVPSTRFSIGQKVKLKRTRSGTTTQCYFYINSITDSASQATLTLSTYLGFDLAAGDIITDIWVSREDVPIGFPERVSTDGWADLDETWAIAQGLIIDVPGVSASRFQVGDKVRLTNDGSVKYFYIVDLPTAGRITLYGGSDYNISAPGITNIAISRAERPFGFPDFFTYAPTLGNLTSTTVTYARFALKGNLCTVALNFRGTMGSPAVTAATATLPIAPIRNQHVGGGMVDIGSGWQGGFCVNTNSTLSISRYDAASFPTSGTGYFWVTFSYEIG